MKRLLKYRIFLDHGSYYSLMATDVRSAIRKARATSRTILARRLNASHPSLRVTRIQRILKGCIEKELRIPRQER
jgi:hypothetical protein